MTSHFAHGAASVPAKGVGRGCARKLPLAASASGCSCAGPAQTSGPIPGERARFRPLTPPVAVWAAFWGRFADVVRRRGRARWVAGGPGGARGSSARPAAWRCVQPRLARGPARRALTRWCAARGGEAVWCAGRRCGPDGVARHAASPVRAVPDRRPAGRRPQAVPVR